MNELTPHFPGFPPQAMRFLADLKANNDRVWFSAHRDVYEAAIRGPAEALIAALTPQLEAMSGEPVTPKIFRIHRDVRFSKDKSPYTTHLHIGFGLGRAEGSDQPSRCGFYFGLEAERLLLGGGAFEFPGQRLDRYRAAVADTSRGEALTMLVAQLTAAGYAFGDPALKRVPAPYPADHPRSELMRRKGLNAWRELTDRSLIESPALINDVLGVFETLVPLNRWIGEAIA